MKNKKILQIITTPYYTPKGSSLRVDSLVQKLSKENTIDIVTYPIGEEVDYKNVDISRVFKGKSWDLGVSEISLKKIVLDIGVFFGVLGMLLKNEYDVIHCEDFEAAFIGAIYSLFFHKKKYVYDFHNSIVDNLEITGKTGMILKVARSLEKFVLKRFDMVIINWGLYENHPVIKGKSHFLLYDKSDISIKKCGLPTNKEYLIYSGNFKKYQGVEEFIKIYAKVKPSYDLVLVGNTTEEITGLIKELKLEGKVLCTGLLDIKESNYLIQKSLLPIIPRISGKQPGLKMIHHIMLGKVSIASKIPANTEYLNDENALLYSSEQELREILIAIDKGNIDQEQFKEKIKACQKEINEIWSYEYFTDNYSKTFE